MEELLKVTDVEEWPEDEKATVIKHIVHRDELMAWMLKYKSYTREQLLEYFTEAEHQDGPEYWEQWQDPHSLASDIRLYFESKGRIKFK